MYSLECFSQGMGTMDARSWVLHSFDLTFCIIGGSTVITTFLVPRHRCHRQARHQVYSLECFNQGMGLHSVNLAFCIIGGSTVITTFLIIVVISHGLIIWCTAGSVSAREWGLWMEDLGFHTVLSHVWRR